MRLQPFRAGRLVLLALAHWPATLHAEDQIALNAQRQFGPIHHAVLKVVPSPGEWRFSRGLLESDLHDFACDYELHSEEATAALRKLLNGAEFADEQAAALDAGILIGVYLTAMDGTLTKVLVAQTVDDGRTRASIDGHRVVAAGPLERDLRKLVVTMVPTTVRYTCEGERLALGAGRP